MLRYAKTSEFSVLAFKSKKAMKSSAKVPKAGGKFRADFGTDRTDLVNGEQPWTTDLHNRYLLQGLFCYKSGDASYRSDLQ